MVSIQKFGIIVLVSDQIEYWSNHSIRFEISNIRTALVVFSLSTQQRRTADKQSNCQLVLGNSGTEQKN